MRRTQQTSAGHASPRRAFAPGLAAAGLSVVLLSACVVAPPAPPPPARPRPVFVESGRTPPPAPVENQNSRMFFYPERGQDEARVDRDRYECYRWAVRESGIDPGMTPLREAQVPPPGPPVEAVRNPGEVVGSAAAGAIVGAAVSGPRHAGTGAVIGAIFGTAIGAANQGARAQAIEQRQAARQERWEARQDAAQRRIEPFRRAMSACMSARGYRIG